MPSRIACDAAARAEAHGATPDGEHTGATCGGRKRTHAAVPRDQYIARAACRVSHESGASVRASRAHGRMITHTAAPSGARADATA